MKYEEIEPYLIDFLKGNVEEATEYRIRAYLKNHPEFEEELDELRTTLEYTQEIPLEEPSPSLKMDFYAMLNQAKIEEKKKKRAFSWVENLSNTFWARWLSIAASLAVILFTGYWSVQLLFTENTTEMSLQNTKNNQEENQDAIYATEEEAPAEEEQRIQETQEIEKEFIQEKKTNTGNRNTQKTKASTEKEIKEIEEKPTTYLANIEDIEENIEEEIEQTPELNTEIQKTRNTSKIYSGNREVLAQEEIQTTRRNTKKSESNTQKNQNKVLFSDAYQGKNDSVSGYNTGAYEEEIAYTKPQSSSESLQELEKTIYQKATQKALIKKLKKEQDPEEQIKIIELIKKYNITRAKNSLQKMSQSQKISKNVREKLKETLQYLKP